MTKKGSNATDAEDGIELVDGSRFRDSLDDETYPLNDSTEETQDLNSSNSSIFDEIAETNPDNIDDFSTSPVFLQQYQMFFAKRRSKTKYMIFGVIVSIFVILWVYILLANSPHKEGKPYEPVQSTSPPEIATTSSSNQEEKLTPTEIEHHDPTNTFESPPAYRSESPFNDGLREFEIHKSRPDISIETFNKGNVYTETKFIRSNKYIAKKDDHGLYLVQENQKYIVKKLADDSFSKSIHSVGKFTHDSTTYNIHDITLSYDLKYAILITDYNKQYRHSGFAHYLLYDIEKGSYTPIKQFDSKVQHASWSPSYNFITFIQENDLFIFEVSTGKVTRITNDGSDDIYNGKPDWVYEEDVLQRDTAFWWSPDEKSLIFMKTDDSAVATLNLETFINNNRYPGLRRLKYPKPGDSNPIVKLFEYSYYEQTIEEINRSDSKLGDEFIIYGGTWVDESKFIIKETNRDSKILNYRLYDSTDKYSKITYEVNAIKEYKGWIENFGNILRIPEDNSKGRPKPGYVDVLNNDGYNHLAYFEYGDKVPTFLTSGDWEVIDGAINFDLESDRIYFTANRRSTFENHIFFVDLRTRLLTMITDFKKDTGFYSVDFSPSTRFLVATKEGPEIPMMYHHDDLQANEKRDEIFEDKRGIDFGGKSKTYHTVQIGTDESGQPITINLLEKLPTNFNKNKKHPLLVHVYGAPGTQFVDVRFHVNMEDSVSDDLNAVIIYIDPRGTTGQGWDYRSWSTGRIGYYEPRDITRAIKTWVDSHSYINENRTALWGWSYGGFSVLKTLEYDQGQVFKYGMAIAPVTDWLMYNSIYTERYMGSPSTNEAGYKESKISDYNAFKKVKRFFLAHGTADDNVHIQNTFKLLDEFNLNNLYNYDLQIYPDSDHNISHHNANSLLVGRLLAWLANAFEGRFDNLH